MKSLKIIIITITFLSIQSLQALETEESVPPESVVVESNEVEAETANETQSSYEPETDDKLNPELLNTLPAVNILNLSGKDCSGIAITRFIIYTLPNSNAGTLYLADGQTEVTENQYLSLEEADGLQFDPNENFEGNATFTYASIDVNEGVDSSPAIVTIPIVAPVVNGEGTVDEVNTTTVEHVEHNSTCDCPNYEKSIPSLSKVGFFGMFMLTILMGTFFMWKET